jgi:hypothetical protein
MRIFGESIKSCILHICEFIGTEIIYFYAFSNDLHSKNIQVFLLQEFSVPENGQNF